MAVETHQARIRMWHRWRVKHGFIWYVLGVGVLHGHRGTEAMVITRAVGLADFC